MDRAIDPEDEVIERWARERPDEVLRAVALWLDVRADQLGHSFASRMARALATDAHMLRLGLLGCDEGIQDT